MSRHLAASAAGYALLLSAWTGWRGAARGRGVEPLQLASVAFLEVVLAVQAVIEAARLLGGGRSVEPATHWGYLVASVLILPMATTNVSRERNRWDASVVAVGLLVACVVTVRMRVTGDG